MSSFLVTEFVKLTQSLWTSVNNDTISPADFRTQVQRYAPKFAGCKYVFPQRVCSNPLIVDQVL